MGPTVLTAKKVILDCIEKGASDPTFAPVYLGATLEGCDAQSVQTDLVRKRESMWSGRTYHSEMCGFPGTYPMLDLTKVPWEFPKSVSFQAVRSGKLRSRMQDQLTRILEALPFRLIPLENSLAYWKESFTDNEGFDPHIDFKLFHPDVPGWITGLERLHMRGSWKIFLPYPSSERELVDQLLTYNRRSAELERARAAQSAPLTSQEEEIANLEVRIAEGLRKLAA